MEVRPGYKKTEVGVIPDEWEVLPMSTLTTEFRGGAPLKPADFTDRGVKVLPKGGVGRTGILRIAEKDIQYCRPEYADAHPRNKVDKAYTIVVLRDLVPSGPSIGLMVEIDTEESFVLAQGVYGFKVNKERADARYLIQLSNTSWYRNLANSIMVGSTQVHITNTAYKKAALPVPSLPEQRAIATALSDVDALLTRLDALISKKLDLKQAAMQQLLTGQTRLPGFSGEWDTAPLNRYARDFIVPMRDKPKRLTGDIPWCRIEDFEGKYLFSSKSDQFVDNESIREMNLKVYPVGTLLVSCSADLGRCAIVGTPLVSNQTFIGLVFDDSRASNEYFYYYMTSKAKQLNNLSSGTTISYLSREQFEAFEVYVPSDRAEQVAIASVLSDMDAELAVLEARRDKTRALKQGMMQELLTGRIRLI